TQVHKQLVEQAGHTLTQSDRQLKELDAALQSQLTTSLQTFGFQLTALSEKFVNDYTPLTERLQSLLQVANGQEAADGKERGAKR
ncbi:MAG: hypothetical protein WED11_04435, partial [Natronospirillum sp.]